MGSFRTQRSLANATVEAFVTECLQQVASTFAFIAAPPLAPELLKHPAGISRRLKDPGGIDESIDLSRDR
jgi:hypothetical protein